MLNHFSTLPSEMFGALKCQNEELKAQLETANEVIRQMRAEMMEESLLPARIKFTPSERVILSLLMKRHLVRREMLMMALYAQRTTCDWPGEKIIDIFVFKLRCKIAVYGITIEGSPSKGLHLPNDSQAILVALRAQEDFPDLSRVAS